MTGHRDGRGRRPPRGAWLVMDGDPDWEATRRQARLGAALIGAEPPGARIGVLALQGAFDAHRRRLAELGVAARDVRQPRRPHGVDGLVMPAGRARRCPTCLTSSDCSMRSRPGSPTACRVRHLRRDDPARQRDPRRATRSAQLRRPRRHRATQRLRPPARQLRDRSRRRRARSGRRSTGCSSGRPGRGGRPGRRRAGPAPKAIRCSSDRVASWPRRSIPS